MGLGPSYRGLGARNITAHLPFKTAGLTFGLGCMDRDEEDLGEERGVSLDQLEIAVDIQSKPALGRKCCKKAKSTVNGQGTL